MEPVHIIADLDVSWTSKYLFLPILARNGVNRQATGGWRQLHAISDLRLGLPSFLYSRKLMWFPKTMSIVSLRFGVDTVYDLQIWIARGYVAAH